MLQRSDISAIDKYIRRCNLGPLSLGRTVELQHAAATASTARERVAIEKELEGIRARARTELRRLQRIKDHRLSRLHGKKAPAPQSRKESCKTGKSRDVIVSSAKPERHD